MEILIGIGFLLFVIIVCVLSIVGTVSDARKYKQNLRRYITSYFSAEEWKDGEEVCSAILWKYNNDIGKTSLVYEVEKMVEEGLLQFRPKQAQGSLMGEYRLAR